ncbi:hypothetical protein [Bacillus fonticola]|uniref:hypothetical protein n=1 Tax=Bacillus fonticola TaxID=2728853 RepID=UPI0014746638|nr:hypothetical protein [Bacillus fonticola]
MKKLLRTGLLIAALLMSIYAPITVLADPGNETDVDDPQINEPVDEKERLSS